jgi:hypothetical protein
VKHITRLYSIQSNWLARHGAGLVQFLLIILSLLLLYWRIVRGYVPIESYVRFEAPPSWVQTIYDARLWMLVLGAAVLAVLIYVELTGHAVSLWLRHTLESRRGVIGLVGAAGLLLGSYLLQYGNLGTADAPPHIGAVWVLFQSIKEGQWMPFWSNYVSLGNPFLEFYSPLYYYAVLLTDLFIHNLNTSTEVTLLVLHVLSAYAMYLYVQKLTGSQLAGVVATLAWSATFYRYNNAISLGRPPTALFIDLWPLQFYLLERLIDSSSNKLRSGAALVLATGAMLWAHMLYGGLAMGFGCLYIAARVFIPWPKEPVKQVIGRFLSAIIAQLAGAATALYYLIPVITERNLVVGAPFNPDFVIPPIHLAGILDFPGTYPDSWYGGFIGNTIVVLALLALIFILAIRYYPGVALIIQLGVGLFLTFAPYYWPAFFDAIFKNIPLGSLVYAIKSPGSYLLFVIGPLTALVGVGCYSVSEFMNRHFAGHAWARQALTPERASLVFAFILLAELVPISVRVNVKYPDNYSGDLPDQQQVLDALAQTPNPAARVMNSNGGMYNMFYLSMLTARPSLLSHIPDTPLVTLNFMEQVFPSIGRDVANGVLTPETAAILYQLDVGYIITDGSVAHIDGLEKIRLTPSAALWRVPHHAVIAATRHPENGNEVVITLPQGGDVPVTVDNYTFTATRVNLNFSLPERAFVQVSYTAYPYLQGVLDNKTIEITPTANGLVGFWPRPVNTHFSLYRISAR